MWKPLRSRCLSVQLTRFTGAVSRQAAQVDIVTLIIIGYQLKSARTHLHTPTHLICKLWECYKLQNPPSVRN